jgi:hypothetical protein
MPNASSVGPDCVQLKNEAMLHDLQIDDRVTAPTIYNPIDYACMPKSTQVDDRKLVFFSSPNKGLKFTLDAFAQLRRRMPDLRLVVGNPGYKRWALPSMAGVQFIGPQPQRTIHEEVSSALCTFVPNFVLPETFGLVFAESKALGTPVLTHDCGAAAEVIADPAQVIPVTAAHRIYEGLCGKLSPRFRAAPARIAAALGLFDVYVDTIRAWRAGGRPVTGPDTRFSLSEVAGQWRSWLAEISPSNRSMELTRHNGNEYRRRLADPRQAGSLLCGADGRAVPP